MDGVAVALVGNKITLLMDGETPIDEDAVRNSLEPLKVRIKGFKKVENMPL